MTTVVKVDEYAPPEGCKHYATTLLGQLLQDVAAIGDRAYGDDHQPGLKRIEMKRPKLLGSMGRMTAERSRNLARVRISPGAARVASFSRPTLSSRNNRLATVNVVAIQ